MDDRSFLELITEENLKKIDIDKRLIDAFKLMIIKIQKYFNEKGYTEKINYSEYLKKYLLEDSDRKLKIIISDQMPYGVGGSYSSTTNQISLNEQVMNSDLEIIAHILCHEFIHFLVHHELDILYGDKWRGETFVDEAYTEHFARDIIPVYIECYGPIPNLLEFYNKIAGLDENYLLLLQHQLPVLLMKGMFPDTFIMKGSRCVDKQIAGLYNNYGYEYDEDYLDIQRSIIEKSSSVVVESLDDFYQLISVINERPAIDEEWIIKFIIDKCSNIISKQDDIKDLIIEYIKSMCEFRKYNGKDVYIINLGDKELVYDGERIYGITDDIDYYYINEKGKEMIEFSDKQGNKVLFDYQNVNLNSRRELLNKKISDLESLLNEKMEFTSKHH